MMQSALTAGVLSELAAAGGDAARGAAGEHVTWWMSAGAIALFIVTYVALVTDRGHRTVVALVGGSFMLVWLLVTGMEHEEKALLYIDFNVIFLLVGMMILVNVMRRTGVFQWVAIKCAKLGRGEPVRIMILLAVATAVLSAFLDNVTTVILIAPVTILVAHQLRIDAVPFLIAEVIASNIGGTATLIGDPPNILISSGAAGPRLAAAGLSGRLSFTDFMLNLTPVVAVAMAAFVLTIWLVFRKRLHVTNLDKARVMDYDESRVITDPVLLRKCLVVLALTLAGFFAHGALGLLPSVVALCGASVLLLWTKEDPTRALEEVEWTTLFFFIGFFLVVGGAEKAGLMSAAVKGISYATQGHRGFATMFIMWASALGSAFFDNIPFTMSMIPVVKDLALASPDTTLTQIQAMWWALALGCCLGGNATLFGAAANLVVAGIAGKNGSTFGFMRYLKYGLVFTIQSMAIATLYVWLRYVAFQ